MRTPTRLAAAALLLAAAACDLPPTAPSARPAPEEPAAVFIDDDFFLTNFGEYASGAQPAGWTQRWDPTPHFRVVDDSTAAGGRVLQWSATGQSRNRWALAFDGFGDAGDQEVITDFRVRSLGGGASAYYMGAAAVRVSGTAADERGYALFFVVVPATGAKAVVLATWTAGAYTQLGSYPYDWQLDAWYRVRLEAMGSSIRARVWPRYTPEPAEWHLSTIDTRYPAGRPGVSHHDNGTVEWSLWRAYVPQTLPPAPAPTALGLQFTGGTAWTLPAGWSATSAPSGVTWRVAADLTVPDGRAMRSVVTTTGRHILRHDDVPDTVAAQEVLVKLRMADADGRGPGVALRHTMNGSSESAYVVYLRPNTGQLEINRFLNGGWLFLDEAPFPNAPGTWYWLRFRAEGTQLSAKAWADGDPEPAGWTATATDTGIGAGSVGLYSYEPNTVDYDLFAYAAGGATAVAPPGTPAPAVSAVVVTPATASVPRGGTQQFHAYGVAGDDSVDVAVDWSATGGTISSTGLYSAGLTTGSGFGVTATLAGGGAAGSAAVDIYNPPPISPPTYLTTFASSPLGSQPPYWVETSAPSGIDWTVAADATATDGRVLRAVGTTTARHVLRTENVELSATDQEVLVKLKLADDDGRGPGVAIRHTMSGSSETAYVAYLRSSTNQVEVNRFLGGAWSFVAAAGFVNDPGAWYWIRFRAEGTALKVRVWADGAAEPAAWTISATDSGIAAGSAGLYVYEPNTVSFDAFSAVSGPGTAPTP